MNNRGQIITLDFLLAMTLVIFSLGLMVGMAELRMYEIKEGIIYKALQEKTEAATIVLSGGGLIGCTTNNGSVIPFSLDVGKTSMITKETLGLSDYNVNLEIGTLSIINEDVRQSKNVISTTIDLVECADGLILTDLNSENIIVAKIEVGK